jgi:hypothetical protein
VIATELDTSPAGIEADLVDVGWVVSYWEIKLSDNDVTAGFHVWLLS